MTLPSPPSDPTTRCVGSASASASIGASDNPPGHALVECVGPVPLPSGTDALDEPSADHQSGASSTASSTTTWTPTHELTRDAWEAVTANIRDRQDRGLWSSREIAITIAQHAGLHRPRAVDLIRSAIKHGYLEERESPLGPDHTSQVRLSPKDGGR
jgi:hypothetical protein